MGWIPAIPLGQQSLVPNFRSYSPVVACLPSVCWRVGDMGGESADLTPGEVESMFGWSFSIDGVKG